MQRNNMILVNILLRLFMTLHAGCQRAFDPHTLQSCVKNKSHMSFFDLLLLKILIFSRSELQRTFNQIITDVEIAEVIIQNICVMCFF